MATDFAVMLHRFLTSHLAGLRGCSPNTIASYRDAFKLLIAFFADVRSIPPGKLTLDRTDDDSIAGFLNWLEAERHNSISTRNQRLAAISSFFRWMQSQDPVRMASCQEILAIPAKKHAQPGVNHLTVEQTRRLLAQPDRSTRRGRRDATLLATLYDTAARVSEFAGLAVRDIRVEPPPLAVLTGKGRKTRHVPLGGNTTALLAAYLAGHGLDQPGHDDHPLFVSQHRSKLSRGGVAWILRKYQAKAGDPALAGAGLSPHILRTARPCTSARQVSHCPTSATSSDTPTFPPPRSTLAPPPRRSARPSRPPTPRSSPTTCPNGTRTRDCSTGSPPCELAHHKPVMRSARSPIRPSW